jgi:hypothetical protein
MQGASVTVSGSSGFFVYDAKPHAVLLQQESGQQTDRTRSHYQDFDLVDVQHKLTYIREALPSDKTP